MIFAAPCEMFLMGANRLRGPYSGVGPDPDIPLPWSLSHSTVYLYRPCDSSLEVEKPTLIAGERGHVERCPLLRIAAFQVGHALHQLPTSRQRLLTLLHH